MARDYKQEYAASRRPDRRKANILRQRARRKMIKAGKVSRNDGKEVDHKKMLATGGSNSISNLKATSRSANRRKQPKHKGRNLK